jgi:hypothetical protein
MKARIILAALLVAASGTFALAGNNDENSLSGKAMHDLPGNNGSGTTANPTAKPVEQSLSGKAMRDQPGNNSGGTTANPTAKPVEQSLSGKAMRDQPGNN